MAHHSQRMDPGPPDDEDSGPACRDSEAFHRDDTIHDALRPLAWIRMGVPPLGYMAWNRPCGRSPLRGGGKAQRTTARCDPAHDRGFRFDPLDVHLRDDRVGVVFPSGAGWGDID